MTEEVLQTPGYEFHPACLALPKMADEEDSKPGFLVNIDEGVFGLAIPTDMGPHWWHWVIFDSEGFRFSKNRTATSRLPFRVDGCGATEIQLSVCQENPYKNINSSPIKNEFAKHLYIIQSDCGGPVKIGRSSDPRSRAECLQVACPFPLKVVRVFKGHGDKEAEAHKSLREYHMHGEWFSDAAIHVLDKLSASWGEGAA